MDKDFDSKDETYLVEEDENGGASPDDKLPKGLAEALAAEVTDAVAYVEEAFSDVQSDMTEFYRGELPGIREEDAEDNRSDFVSRDVHDAVAAYMPDLMRVFTGPEHVLEFRPNGHADEAYVEQATAAVRNIFENENDAWGIIHGGLKDGLIRKYGVATWFFEETDVSYEKEYTGLDLEAMTLLLNEPDIEVLEMESYAPEDPETGAETYDLTLLHKRSVKKYVVDLVPPEELIIARAARAADGKRFIGRRRSMPIHELVAMGYDEDELKEFAGAGGDSQLKTNALTYERNPEGQNAGPERQDEGGKEVLYVEGFMEWLIDGRMQLVKACMLGSAYKVKSWEKVEAINLAVWTPDPEPHTPIGEALSEKAADFQRVNTEIWRGVLDSLQESLVPRTEVVEGQVNLDDAMSNELGALVRVRQPGMVRPISQPFVGQAALPLLTVIDQKREERVGAFRAADGLSAEAMQSSTKMAVAATITGSKAQKELMARNFAANFLKPIFRGLLRLFVENQDKPKTMKLAGEWVPIDPRGWNAELDMDVNVADAMMPVEERLQKLGAVVQKQESILQTLGAANPLVTLAQYSTALQDLTRLAGFRKADRYFNRVDPNWQAPAKQEQPDAALLLAQAQIKSIELNDNLKLEESSAKLNHEREKQRLDDDFRRDQLAQEGILKQAEIEQKYGADLTIKRLQIESEVSKHRDGLVADAFNAANAPMPAQPTMMPEGGPSDGGL
jgi:hypothetical protein